ncbi:GNAT family N-acetyltransferase [Streptomyces sp. JJ66]|uniref:GNAT family N-acetyltransferase n=1 Tax=Streptomyces sp. JJ66 TaxID=2803843 RepID=UPI001C59575D|nr:GNAT family N-acetyltransferase [Streptomyces sp. JJ66]MBW1603252.1 GNAT family N-acetyltransferase [Streptomyces sp. JJ66]
MEPVTLTTERLLLRPLEPRDADAVLAACQDPDVQRWTTVPSPYERRHAEDFVHTISPAGWRADTLYTFGVFDPGGELVGSMGLVNTSRLRTERVAEIGYWTAPGQRGRGYTVEAARAVADWAFGALGVERLEWFAGVGNEASRSVALRVGFVMEGVQRARMVHRGRRVDAWAASLLPSDWGRASATPYAPSDGG